MIHFLQTRSRHVNKSFIIIIVKKHHSERYAEYCSLAVFVTQPIVVIKTVLAPINEVEFYFLLFENFLLRSESFFAQKIKKNRNKVGFVKHCCV